MGILPRPLKNALDDWRPTHATDRPTMNSVNRYGTPVVLAMTLAGPHFAVAAAIDDVKVEISHDRCEGADPNDKNFVVYATNLNSSQTIDANFKYDTNPPQRHFILFDADLNPITDRFPKFHVRRLSPHETAAIGCTYTYRAAPAPPGPVNVPLVITQQSASYIDANAAEAAPEDARSFVAFLLQGGLKECAAGAKPPGLFYLVNLHPYARLSASMNLLDDHGTRVGVLTPTLLPMSAARVACSNGTSKPGPITNATLEEPPRVAATLPAVSPPEAKPPLPEHREAQEPREPQASTSLPPLSLGTILTTQNVCAGSVPTGWIKINDAWNPTVCGNPATITYNVWIIQQLSDQPPGAVLHACKGTVPSGWAIVGTAWNPTVCGHPTSNQSNVMAIKRLN
jgi:hypothetical protein